MGMELQRGAGSKHAGSAATRNRIKLSESICALEAKYFGPEGRQMYNQVVQSDYHRIARARIDPNRVTGKTRHYRDGLL
jgi:hypothetical protein